MKRPPRGPVGPKSRPEGYSGTPLPKKLGIRPGSNLLLVHAPESFERALTGLPEDVIVRRDGRSKADMILWFVRSKAELRSKVKKFGSAFVGNGGLWIAWPKKASGLGADLTEDDVRRIAIASGLVDFKVCAIDATWSGLRFSRRAGSGS